MIIFKHTHLFVPRLATASALKKDDNEELAKAKAKLVAELLTSEEENLVSGGRNTLASESDGPHWREFTKFVMAQ